MSMSLRVKKYRISTSLGSWAMNSLAPCSWGRRMLTPSERSRPRPRIPAAMMPGPAPVTTIQPRSAMRSASRRACTYKGSSGSGPGRAEERHLLLLAEGPEHPEGLGHLGHGGAGDLQVDGVGVLLGQVEHRARSTGTGRAGGGAHRVEQRVDQAPFVGVEALGRGDVLEPGAVGGQRGTRSDPPTPRPSRRGPAPRRHVGHLSRGRARDRRAWCAAGAVGPGARPGRGTPLRP